MLFNTTEFVLFFAAVLSLYYSPVCRTQQVNLLVAASFIFYSLNQPQWALLLAFSIMLNAIASWQIALNSERKFRITCAAVCVTINVMLLFSFKYAALIASVVPKFFHGHVDLSSLADVALPVGISFYTFEGISLLVDSFKKSDSVRDEDDDDEKQAIEQAQEPGRKREHERKGRTQLKSGLTAHMKNTSLFFSFFPHLAAGPIVRPHQFFPQIREKKLSDVDFKFVMETLITGYFFKNVVADNLVTHTSGVLATFANYSSANDLAALFGYSARIFSDFAGYSLIAIGLAAALGYQLPRNFNFPYRSQSLSEFWTRWHITLSRWIRDYLYIPLGGNQKGRIRTYINLLTVMFLGGLWHGGKNGFAVWGLYHGVLLSIERAVGLSHKSSSGSALVALRVLCTFLLVTIGWLIFALPLHAVPHFCKSIIENRHWTVGVQQLFLVALFSLPVVAWHIVNLLKEKRGLLPGKEPVLALMLFLIITDSGVPQDFVYFQF